MEVDIKNASHGIVLVCIESRVPIVGVQLYKQPFNQSQQHISINIWEVHLPLMAEYVC